MILDFLNQHETRISFESHETQKMITIKPEDTLEGTFPLSPLPPSFHFQTNDGELIVLLLFILSVLGLNKAQLELLTSFMIFTVRQFALMIEKDLLHYGDVHLFSLSLLLLLPFLFLFLFLFFSF